MSGSKFFEDLFLLKICGDKMTQLTVQGGSWLQGVSHIWHMCSVVGFKQLESLVVLDVSFHVNRDFAAFFGEITEQNCATCSYCGTVLGRMGLFGAFV
jgi:hypothetical protein